MSSLFEDLKEGLEEAISFEKGDGEAKTKMYMIMPVKEKKVYKYKEIEFKVLKKKLELPVRYVEKVNENWKREMNAGKSYTNGKLYTMAAVNVLEDKIRVYVQETNFAHYLYSRSIGIDENSCRSMAANALLVTSDDYIVFGIMSGSTSLANRVNFIGGAFDQTDFCNEIVDIKNCITREVKEEVGLNLNDKETVTDVRPIAILTREKFSFANTLFLVDISLDKSELERRFTDYKQGLEAAGEKSELSELIYIGNNYTSILKFFQDENNLVIDYMHDFFDAYFGKIEYGNIQEYIVNNLPEMT